MENSTSESHSMTAIKSTYIVRLIPQFLYQKLPSVEQEFIRVKLC